MEYFLSENLRIEFTKAKKAFMDASKIVIVSHRSPDGDAVGSNLALKIGLESMGKTVVSACVDPVAKENLFLKGTSDFVNNFNYADFDLIVAVDCGDIKLFKFHETKPEILTGGAPFLNIDHHESNNFFGTLNMVDAHACATCEIIYKFFRFCGWKISIDIATSLLCGIYFDTGGLMHSNTNGEVYKIAGDLVSKGADFKRVGKELFHTTPVNRLRLLGRILERTHVNEEGVTISAVSKNDYESLGANSKDTSGAIDYLNAVPDSRYCVLLAEDDKGIVKGSLRTRRNDINLSEVASQWGGGGHPKASGFGISGKLVPVLHWKVVSEQEGGAHGVEF